MTTKTATKTPAKKTTARPAVKPAAQKATPAPKEPKPTAGAKAKESAHASKKVTKPEPKTLIEALTTKQAALIKVRANGTRRSLPYLAVGTDERKAAEAVAARASKGETVAAIAEDLNVSLATARRFLTNLALTHAVEAGSHDKSWKPGTKEVVVHTVTAKA
ncbi:hypothetical protein [Nocardioides caricicola]|uniref:HTH domain-containing protein n=1 Tax=Nocardioides caricicola TaxID=634770 RepID=A0ABW0N3D4_9ACTN